MADLQLLRPRGENQALSGSLHSLSGSRVDLLPRMPVADFDLAEKLTLEMAAWI